MTTLAKNIRKYRKMLGLTQAQLAEVAEIPRATAAGAEKPNSNPTIDVVFRLSQALGVGIDELMKDEEQEVIQVLSRQTKPMTSPDGVWESTTLTPITAKHVIIQRIKIAPHGHYDGKPHPPGTQEFFAGHSGEATVTIRKQGYVVKPGDLVSFAGDQPHGYTNEGDEPYIGYSVMAFVGSPS